VRVTGTGAVVVVVVVASAEDGALVEDGEEVEELEVDEVDEVDEIDEVDDVVELSGTVGDGPGSAPARAGISITAMTRPARARRERTIDVDMGTKGRVRRKIGMLRGSFDASTGHHPASPLPAAGTSDVRSHSNHFVPSCHIRLNASIWPLVDVEGDVKGGTV